MDFEGSGSQSLLVIMASEKYASFNFGKEIFMHTFHRGKLCQK